MLTIDLEKRLLSTKRRNTEDQLAIDEASKILAANDEKGIALLRGMGLDHSIRRSANLSAINKGLDQSRVFAKDEIESLCLAYRLRFLDISCYKGNIDPKLPSKLKEFETLYKSSGNKEADFSRCKIVAPMENFKLKERPVDPLLFYPIGDGFYYLIHKWGSDVSIFRLLKGIKFRTYWTWYFTSLLTYWVPATALTVYALNGNPLFMLLAIPPSIIHFLFARFCDYKDTNYTYLESNVSAKNWNSNYR